jgi:predicted O-methyltransferase YrrM
MGDVYWGLHAPLAALIARRSIRVAVETGTFYGIGALQLATLFEQVISIESNERLHAFCSSVYPQTRIRFIKGDSAHVLKAVAHELEEAALFFLDAHWFPNPQVAAAIGPQCPLLAELSALKAANVVRQGSVIMIDDADMFLGSLPSQFKVDEFPSISEILNILQSEIHAEFVDVLDDVIVAGPSWLNDVIVEYKSLKREFGGPSSKRITA